METIAVSELRANLKKVIKKIENGEKSAQLSAKITIGPADGIIAATSIITRTPLITADTNLRESSAVLLSGKRITI